MKYLLTLIILLAIFSPLIACADVENLTHDSGSSYIHWQWNYTGTTTNTTLILDGTIIDTSYTHEYYVISDLKPRELHILELQNNTNSALSNTNSGITFYPQNLFYLIFLIMIIFFFSSIIIPDEVIALTLSTFTFVISIFCTYMSFPYNFPLISFICALFIVFSFLWALYTVIMIMKPEIEDMNTELDD